MVTNSKYSRKIPLTLLRSIFIGALSCYFLRTLLILRTSCQREGDLALIALNVMDAMQGQHLVGAYSRYHFSHPGPILFYLYGGGTFLFAWMESFAGRLLATQELINIAALVGIACIQNSKRKDWSSGILLSTSVFIGIQVAHPRSFEQIWNPIALLCPLAAYLSVISRLSPVSVWRLPVAMALAACLVQVHVGSVAILAPSLLYAVGRYCITNGLRTTLRPFAIGVLSSGALLAPVLYESLQGPHFGNLGTIFEFIRTHSEKHTTREIFTVIGEMYYSPIIGSTLVILIAVTPLCARWRASGLPIVQLDILALAQFGMYLSAVNTYGPLYQYLLWSHVVIGALYLGEILVWATSRNARNYEPIASTALVAAVGYYLPYAPEYCGDLTRANSIVEQVAHLPAPFCIDINANEQFGPAALVALRLEQLGKHIYVPRPWATHFGKNHAPGCTTAEWIIRFSKNPDTSAAPGIVVHQTEELVVTLLPAAEWRIHRRKKQGNGT
jgi:hypothetical protein